MTIDPMAEIRASFFIECDELMESLQDALGRMADGCQDAETINVVFRAVHSIKGGAGAFGLTGLVSFAHRFETVMDALRSGGAVAGEALIKGLFAAADGLTDEIAAARYGRPAAPEAASGLTAIETFLPDAALPSPQPDAEVGFEPLAVSFDFEDILATGADRTAASAGQAAAAAAPTLGWRIHFRPHHGLYTSGNEPFLLFAALRRLGTLTVDCDMTGLPDLARLQQEESYLSWTLALWTNAPEAEVLDIFDFVADVCDLTLSPISEDSLVADTRLLPREPAPSASKSSGAPRGGTVLPTAAAAPEPAALSVLPVPPVEAAPTVRVELDRIDRLVNQVGELVIGHAMLAQSIVGAGIGRNSDVMRGLDAFVALTRDIQDSVMTIRAQPVKPLFQRMARIVREASAAVGKNVCLVTEGEATEIDKTVVERLADPLTHIIRNAVDHGIERPEVRIASGKPPAGTVTLRAQHRSGRVLIEIADDGGGIDRGKVADIARWKRLVPEGAALGEADIDALLFLPGFSTAATVSALSGRGVGMDVVKRSVQSLGGRIAIQSDPGRGTTLSISLPLTLAVLDGMIVTVGGQTLVVPLAAVTETATLAAADVCALAGTGRVARLRGEFLPVCDLGAELGYRRPWDVSDGQIVLLTQSDDGDRAALIVDAILEQRQVVIKGIGNSYGRIPGIAAATILGDGQIALIVDPGEILRLARLRAAAGRQGNAPRPPDHLQHAG